MSNLPSNVNEEIQPALLAVAAFVHGGDAIFVVQVEVFPSVEETISRNPDVNLNFHRPPKAVVEVFRYSFIAKFLAEFNSKYGLPYQVELIPSNGDEVYTHHPGHCALFTYPFTIGYPFPLPPFGGRILLLLSGLSCSTFFLRLQGDLDVIKIYRDGWRQDHRAEPSAPVYA